jgi:hypothetical protein
MAKSGNVSLAILSIILFGCSLGIMKGPNIQLALQFVPPESKGMGAATMGVLRSLGLVLGVLFFETIFSGSIKGVTNCPICSIKFSDAAAPLLSKGFLAPFLFGLAINVLAFISISLVEKKPVLTK